MPRSAGATGEHEQPEPGATLIRRPTGSLFVVLDLAATYGKAGTK